MLWRWTYNILFSCVWYCKENLKIKRNSLIYTLYVDVVGLKRKLKHILVTNIKTFWGHLIEQHFRPLNLLSSIHTSVYFIRYFNVKSVFSFVIFTLSLRDFWFVSLPSFVCTMLYLHIKIYSYFYMTGCNFHVAFVKRDLYTVYVNLKHCCTPCCCNF